MNKKFKTLGFVFLLTTFALLCLIGMQVLDFVRLGYEKTSAYARFQDSNLHYQKVISTPDISENDKMEMRIEIKHLEHQYKLLKYEKKLKFTYIKLYSIFLGVMGMILYRNRSS